VASAGPSLTSVHCFENHMRFKSATLRSQESAIVPMIRYPRGKINVVPRSTTHAVTSQQTPAAVALLLLCLPVHLHCSTCLCCCTDRSFAVHRPSTRPPSATIHTRRTAICKFRSLILYLFPVVPLFWIVLEIGHYRQTIVRHGYQRASKSPPSM
jgi:hypothetical protein